MVLEKTSGNKKQLTKLQNMTIMDKSNGNTLQDQKIKTTRVQNISQLITGLVNDFRKKLEKIYLVY